MTIKHEQFIGIYEGIYSADFCNRVIKHYEDLKEAGFGHRRDASENIVPLSRDDETVFPASEPVLSISATKELCSEFNDVFWGIGYAAYAEKFGILKTFDTHSIHCARIQKTVIGAGYHVWHCEHGSIETSRRLLAWTLYLNDVEEGGETEYLYQHLRVKPKQGTLVIWPAGFTHVHRGNPPLSNTKYIFTGWVEY